MIGKISESNVDETQERERPASLFTSLDIAFLMFLYLSICKIWYVVFHIVLFSLGNKGYKNIASHFILFISDSRFTQQELPACKPILTPRWVCRNWFCSFFSTITPLLVFFYQIDLLCFLCFLCRWFLLSWSSALCLFQLELLRFSHLVMYVLFTWTVCAPAPLIHTY